MPDVTFRIRLIMSLTKKIKLLIVAVSGNGCV